MLLLTLAFNTSRRNSSTQFVQHVGETHPGAALQDILRLLTLWFNHGSAPDVEAALQEGFGHVSIDTWLVVIPQVGSCSASLSVPSSIYPYTGSCHVSLLLIAGSAARPSSTGVTHVAGCCLICRVLKSMFGADSCLSSDVLLLFLCCMPILHSRSPTGCPILSGLRCSTHSFCYKLKKVGLTSRVNKPSICNKDSVEIASLLTLVHQPVLAPHMAQLLASVHDESTNAVVILHCLEHHLFSAWHQ